VGGFARWLAAGERDDLLHGGVWRRRLARPILRAHYTKPA
jgi:hypothetical protein